MYGIDLFEYVNKALYLSLVLSLPSIIAASVVGTIFAVIQALTQIQEQTLSHAVKLIATVVAITLTMRWSGMEVYQFTTTLFDLIPSIGRIGI